MSFIIQYLVLRKLIYETYTAMQTPTNFKIPYKWMKMWYVPDEIHIFGKVYYPMLCWKYCYYLWKLDCIQLSQERPTNAEGVWCLALTQKGTSYMLSLKMTFIKAFFSVVLAAVSALLGFVIGRL
jgi:hypothetical protein